MHISAFDRHSLLKAVALIAVVTLAACGDRSPTEVDHGEAVAAEVRDRDSGERLAWTHGEGSSIHWEGSLPQLAVGEGIEVDVVFLDENGTQIPLGGEFEARAEVASGAPSGVIQIEAHGDHVDIEALEVGETEIVFHLWHGGHADWSTPAIALHVES